MALGGDPTGGNPILFLLPLVALISSIVPIYFFVKWKRKTKNRLSKKESISVSRDTAGEKRHSLYYLSGTVSEVKTLSETEGYVVRGRGRVSTRHKNFFRLDNKPIMFVGHLDVSTGDIITAVGQEKDGQFIARAIKNKTTGADYFSPITQHYFVGWTFILCGLPLSLILIGLPLLGVGVYHVIQGSKNGKAKAMIYQGQFAGQLE